MNRKGFIKKSITGLGGIIALPLAASSCEDKDTWNPGNDACAISPGETAGPFPNKTPADLVRENIISDRTGIPLLIQLTILEHNIDCNPLAGALVDIWHCDAIGQYSQYGGNSLQKIDLSGKSFLRGRQITNAFGEVSFLSIFPGWYPGRAPHIHLEILNAGENSLLISQIAFPKDSCDQVYATTGYKGEADTLNNKDGVFSNSLSGNMADAVSGNITDGFILEKTIIL